MALTYTRSTLVSLSSSLQKILLHPNLWRSLTQLRISRIKPTRRGCKAGLRKLRTSNQRDLRPSSSTSNNPNYARFLPSSIDFFQDEGNLHNLSTIILDIQDNTFPVRDNNSIPVADARYSCITARVTDRQKTNLASKNNLQDSHPANLIKIRSSVLRSSYNFPKILLSNTRSMVNKVDEISSVITINKCDIAVITESWLSSNISNDMISVPDTPAFAETCLTTGVVVDFARSST